MAECISVSTTKKNDELICNNGGAEVEQEPVLDSVSDNVCTAVTSYQDQESFIVESCNSEKNENLVNGYQLTLSLHGEQLEKLLDAFQVLERHNNELKHSLAETCSVVKNLEGQCATLEEKNKALEQTLQKVVSSGDHTATTVTQLASDFAAFKVVSCEVKSDNGKLAESSKNQASEDTIPQLTAEQRIVELERSSAEASVHLTQLASSANQIELDLQRFIRRHSLVVEHLCPKEDRSAQDAFLVFVKSVLNVSADDSDIDSLHLIERQDVDQSTGSGAAGKGSPTRSAEHQLPRPILVTFTCYRTRMRIYKAWLSYRVGASGDAKAAVGALSCERGQGVCIREYLTVAQETVYRAACDIRHNRPGMITDCWTFRGRTFVRTAQGDVRDFSEIDQMITKDDSRNRCIVM